MYTGFNCVYVSHTQIYDIAWMDVFEMNSMTHTHLLVSKQDKISISYYEDLVVQITQIINLYFGHFYIQVFSEPKKKHVFVILAFFLLVVIPIWIEHLYMSLCILNLYVSWNNHHDYYYKKKSAFHCLIPLLSYIIVI